MNKPALKGPIDHTILGLIKQCYTNEKVLTFEWVVRNYTVIILNLKIHNKIRVEQLGQNIKQFNSQCLLSYY